MNRARVIVFSVFGVLLAAQMIRPALTNPPVVAEPHWDSPRTRELVRRACFDCHSNETRVPWYGQVAPFRWLVAHHVAEGREHLNFSDPASGYEVDEMVGEIRKGAMPTWDYKLVHAAARLSQAEQDSLVAGLEATFATNAGDSLALGKVEAGHKDGGGRDDDEGHEGRTSDD